MVLVYHVLCYHPTDKLTLGKMAKLLISFKNPLPVEMKDIILNIDVDNLSES